jgi:hypothetical protein
MYKINWLGDNGSNNILIDVVANRGEDLRFPISSSSGFSSPFAFFPEMDIEGPCRNICRAFYVQNLLTAFSVNYNGFLLPSLDLYILYFSLFV